MANEVHTLVVSGSILILIAIFLPFIQQEFQGSSTDFGTDNINSDIQDEPNAITLFTITVNIFRMLTWSFGLVPFWVDGLLLIVRLMFWASIIKLLPTT